MGKSLEPLCYKAIGKEMWKTLKDQTSELRKPCLVFPDLFLHVDKFTTDGNPMKLDDRSECRFVSTW